MGNPWIKSWNGNVLIVGQVYQVNGNFYTYAGDFQKMEDVQYKYYLVSLYF